MKAFVRFASYERSEYFTFSLTLPHAYDKIKMKKFKSAKGDANERYFFGRFQFQCKNGAM